jgi:hypothetical protein
MTAPGAPPGTIVMPAEIDARFGDGSLFKRSAYRLELLDEYDSPRTRVRVARFLAGQTDDAEVRAYWDRVVGEARRVGKTMQRVHVITEPLTDYLRFELAFYRGSVLAGEDIRILPGDLAVGLVLPGFDYWLFDGERAAVMYYGDRGTWLHTEIVTESSFVTDCRRWRDQALSRAVPLGDYIAKGARHDPGWAVQTGRRQRHRRMRGGSSPA